jgi:hypothetical protein
VVRRVTVAADNPDPEPRNCSSAGEAGIEEPKGRRPGGRPPSPAVVSENRTRVTSVPRGTCLPPRTDGKSHEQIARAHTVGVVYSSARCRDQRRPVVSVRRHGGAIFRSGRSRRFQPATTAGRSHLTDHTADASIVINRFTGTVLGGRNSDRLRAPASTTKMMTGLLAIAAIEDGWIGVRLFWRDVMRPAS